MPYHRNKITSIILIFSIVAISIVIGYQIGKKYDIALDENDRYVAITYSLNEQKMRRLMSLVDNYYVDSINTDELVDKTIAFVTQNLDPHSAYIPKTLSSYTSQEMEGYYEGIGINYIIYNDSLVISHPTEFSPNKNLFRLSDRILSVNNKKIDSSNIDSAYLYIRGKPNSQVTLGILRDGIAKTITAKRGRIPQPSVKQSYMISSDLGYIALSKFIETSAQEVRLAIQDLKNKGMKTLILDLRGNPGGLLSSAQEIADEFLPKDKLIVFTKDKQGKKNFRYATETGSFERQPLYVLIDDGSASASEIVAGALQDQDAATIIGRRSFGKGLVQREISLGDGSKIRLTTAKYYTPTGRSIQKPYSINDKNYANDITNRYANGELFTQDSIHIIDSLKYKTPKGKIVYGGGGIIPDVFIPIDSTGNSKWFFEHGKNRLFEKAVFSFVDKNHTSLTQIKESHFISFYQVDSLCLQLLKQSGLTALQKDTHFYPNFKLFIKATMAKYLYGEKAYNRIWNTSDPMIIKAEELSKTQS